MHVLHLHSGFNAGGKELRAVRLMQAFGPDIAHAVVSAQPGAYGAADVLDPALHVTLGGDFPALQGRPTPARLWRIARAMQGYDLVLSYNWGAMDAVLAHRLFARRLGLGPLVHHEDGFNEDEAGGLKWQRNLFRRAALAGAAALVVPSQRLAAIAREAWHQPASRVRLIGNGIPTARYTARPAPDSLPGLTKAPGTFWLGTLAGLRAVKNLPRLVRAFATLPQPWQLVIVGEGPERTAILAEAQRLGVAERVHLPGFVADPARVVGLFDLFALSSDSEQFPISVVESMAAGLAIAAPAVGDVAAMVAGENRPFITPAGDEEALARALGELAGDGALRARVGAANQAHAQAFYDENAMISAYRETYAAAMGGAQGWPLPS
ncbi:glycosyltransferase [Novosphingobium mangrovi (ex Hu et al. 2023)]|uniref:Glycosyltransferase n=1 Tax=Novosphingobium mangrovi (ex Hu et al. 2023) TaxID=2930094 RepID=A0ABT0AI45_9SPHN|nr:glycosyltransferase [Novosphingobium mangrovi (ex Hu et al. 2023)]MCJ1962855.1 glycosyltransferase [Novosphingobium mangrovi (ex Hu et al. 2023)]